MTSQNKEFGQWLKAEIKKAGWSSSSFSRALGFTSQELQGIYLGRTRLSADRAVCMGMLLGVKPEVLLYKQADFQLAEAKKANTFKPDFSLKKLPNHPKQDAIVEMYKAGIEPQRIASLLGISRQHAYKTLANAGVSVK